MIWKFPSRYRADIGLAGGEPSMNIVLVAVHRTQAVNTIPHMFLVSGMLIETRFRHNAWIMSSIEDS
jgi:hypothetical protein